MGLYIKQNENRSQLQEKLARELQEKAKKKALLQDQPDGVEDSRFVQGTANTGKYAWIWIIIIAAVLALVVYLTISTQLG